MVKILVDADACPVKQIIIDEARKENLTVLMVASIAHHIEAQQGVDVLRVDNISQAADMAIINHVNPHDIVVTQDYGLASLVLGKRAFAISPRGTIFDDKNIDTLLMQRHIHQKMRRAKVHVKGVKARTGKDDERFLVNFRKIIFNAKNHG